MASLFSGEGNEAENLFVRYGIRILCSYDTEKFHFVYGFAYPVMKSGRFFTGKCPDFEILFTLFKSSLVFEKMF